MTNEEAIKRLQSISNEIDDIFIFSADEKHEAIDLAIKALEERPKGKWIREYVEYMGMTTLVCSECHYPMGQVRDCFCANCGAQMEG